MGSHFWQGFPSVSFKVELFACSQQMKKKENPVKSPLRLSESPCLEVPVTRPSEYAYASINYFLIMRYVVISSILFPMAAFEVTKNLARCFYNTARLVSILFAWFVMT